MYTSRSSYPDNLPTSFTQFCFECKSAGVNVLIKGGNKKYECESKGCVSERFLVWDSKMVQYFNENDELVHASVGTFVQKEDGKILLFLRTKFPFEWTIPAGHLEVGEDSKNAALRELYEEVGVKDDDAELIFEGELRGESCVGGADIHKWSLYLMQVSGEVEVFVGDEEGSKFMWASLDDLPNELTEATKMLLDKWSQDPFFV
jgi:8-oxo-dGTP pyrophosphatase MutT (NUDIX family)